MKSCKSIYVLIVAILVLLSLALAGCHSVTVEPEVETTPIVVPTVALSLAPALTPTAATTQTPSETLKPVPLSATTGLPFDGDYKPILAVIENSPAARPQLGLQTADIVYEFPVEGSITRFLCLFSDNIPEEIMPVRSGRVPFLFVVHEYDAIFMHFGGSGSGSKSSPHNIYTHHLRDEEYDVDGLSGHWSDYFYRSKEASAPHNVVGNPLLAQQNLYDYQPELPSWMFDENVTYQGEDGNEISLKLCSKVTGYVSYTYDEVSQKYLRFMRGKEFISAETGDQVSVTNIILQYSTYKTSSKIKLWKMVGEGKAVFFIGGKKIIGTWERPDEDSNTIFYDSNGDQIVLKPGNTWIHICPE